MMLIPRLEKLWSTSWTWRNYKWMTDFETGFNRKELKTYKDWVGSESWSFGFKTEGSFGDLLRKHYKDVREATLQEQYKHMDWICDIGSIDVKAIKRVSRHGDKNADLIWIEFRNTSGNAGWIYGQQDFVAFEGNDNYLLVRRSDLCRLSEKLCNLNLRVDSPKDALYKSYSRRNTRDIISMIKRDDLLTINHKLLLKNGSLL